VWQGFTGWWQGFAQILQGVLNKKIATFLLINATFFTVGDAKRLYLCAGYSEKHN
jgi:hypothetical protein